MIIPRIHWEGCIKTSLTEWRVPNQKKSDKKFFFNQCIHQWFCDTQVISMLGVFLWLPGRAYLTGNSVSGACTICLSIWGCWQVNTRGTVLSRIYTCLKRCVEQVPRRFVWTCFGFRFSTCYFPTILICRRLFIIIMVTSFRYQGLWKKDSQNHWVKTHELMWPEEIVPDLLVPTSLKRKRDDGSTVATSELSNSWFPSSTVPTSMMFSAICHQITQTKVRKSVRSGASMLLFDILKKLLATNGMRARFTSDDGEYSISIPRSGMVPTPVLVRLIDETSLLDATRQAWNKDSKEWVRELIESFYFLFATKYTVT